MKIFRILTVIAALVLLLSTCADKTTGPDDSQIKFLGFSPDSGYVNSTLTLYFNNLPNSSKILFEVYLNNIKITNFTNFNDSVKITVPQMDTGAVKIKVIVDTFTFEPEKRFFIKPSNTCELFSFTPDSGIPGDKVTLYGKNLLSDSIKSVSFENFNADIIYLSDDSLNVIVPSMNPGLVDIKVLTLNNELKFGKKFFIKAPNIPEVSSFEPDSGFAGDEITLIGKYLLSDSIKSVNFGTFSADIISKSDDYLKVKVPSMKSGFTDIKIFTRNYELKFGKRFFVKEPDSFIPNFNSIYFEFKNIKLLIRDHGYISDFPYSESHDTTYLKNNYKDSFKYEYQLLLDTLNTNIYRLYRSEYYNIVDIKFELDEENSLIKNFNLYGNITYVYGDGKNEYKITKAELNNMPYLIANDTLKSIFTGKSLVNKVDSISTFYKRSQYYNGYYGENITEITKLLEFTDSSQVIISIYRK